MPDQAEPPQGAEEETYSIREAADVLGLTRQAVHARLLKGQLAGLLIDGAWRIPSRAVGEAVQASRRRLMLTGNVRLLPAPSVPAALERHVLSPVEDSNETVGTALAEMQERIERLELAAVERERASSQAMAAYERELQDRDAEIARLREEGRRVRAALRSLVQKDE